MRIWSRRFLLPGLLFAATFATATLAQGPVYAATILLLLSAHEMGHYLACRVHGVEATLPRFLPFPSILGTMGAVISLKSPIPHRKALFDIGVAGPLAGLALALPVTLFGLFLSHVAPVPFEASLSLGEPPLFRWIARLLLGPIPEGYDIHLHPIAFAGWAMLFVTSINLFPVGQLDGGHLAYALFGKHARWVAWGMLPLLAYLGWAYQPMWYFFLALVAFFLLKHPAPLDPAPSLGPKRVALALLTFGLAVLCFTPVPFDYRV